MDIFFSIYYILFPKSKIFFFISLLFTVLLSVFVAFLLFSEDSENVYLLIEDFEEFSLSSALLLLGDDVLLSLLFLAAYYLDYIA